MNKYTGKKPNFYIIETLKQINQKEEFNLLEIGCNTGYNLKALNDIYPNANYYGIDILSEAITEAKEDFPKGKFYVQNIEEENFFTSESFDYIICPDVLEHLTFPDKVLRKISRLLKEDGYIIANIPNLMHWSLIVNLLLYGNFSYTDIGLLDYDHKHLFTYFEIIKLFQNNGLKIQDIFNIAIDKIPDDYHAFFNVLTSVSDDVKIFQYESFSYIVIAKKIKLTIK